MTFANFSLNPKILRAVEEAGYTQPTKIQLETIPKVMEGLDIRASAQTGTGKTAAFLLPALDRLATPSNAKGKGPRVLILAPTRELAMQIAVQSEKYSKHLNKVKTVCIGGGVSYHIQMRKLSRPYDVLVATPGRLIDYMDRGKIDFSRLEVLVLDEADRMLDMGFIDPVKKIVAATPKSRQTMLFSATMDKSIIKLSEQLLDDPIQIAVHANREKNDNIEQKFLYADNLNHKNKLLSHLLKEEGVDYTIVFTSTKRHADQLVDELHDEGFLAAALHGDMNQRHRTRTITKLRNGHIKILVATDVAARGIDVQSITHVINFDLPRHIEDYVHRIGRTGRAGAKGIAYSFVGGQDAVLAKKIEQYTGQTIDSIEIEGLQPQSKPRASDRPARPPRNRRRGNQGFKGQGNGNGSGSRKGSGYGGGDKRPGSKPGNRFGSRSSSDKAGANRSGKFSPNKSRPKSGKRPFASSR